MSIPATVLRRVGLRHEKCVSEIDYFVRDINSPTILISKIIIIAISLDDVDVESNVPKVPSYVHFRPPKKNPGSFTHHESAKAQVARRIVQWICWKYHGSIATPKTIRKDVNILLEKSFLKKRVSIQYTSDSSGRPMICFIMRYFNTELKSDALYTHRMTGMGMTHWENIDDLPDCRYGRSGKPDLPQGLDAEARGKCERLFLLARRICSELENFEGTPSELYEQITKMKEPYMEISYKSYLFEQTRNPDALEPTRKEKETAVTEAHDVAGRASRPTQRHY